MLNSFCCVVVLVSMCALPMAGQSQRGIPPSFSDMSQTMNRGISPSTDPVDPAQAQWQLQAARRENQNRQIALRQDTDKLLELAAELKQNVDRTGPDILSMDVVKKAQEIEKLAKSVKDKMKGN